jgi:DNA helicase-4
MELQQTIQELHTNIVELQRQYWLNRLRRILKLVIIGFFIGRNSEKRIQELAQKNQALIQRIIKYIASLGVQEQGSHQHIESINVAYATLTSARAKAKSFIENSPPAKPSILEVDKELADQIQLLIEHLKDTFERHLDEFKSQVEKIESSNTYLTSADQKQHTASIQTLAQDLDYCAGRHLLDKNFTSKYQTQTRHYLKRVQDFNTHFITRRKKEYSNLWHIDPLSLDDEQQTAIVTDDKHNLVIAAAGSGKTEVLTTRIAYLTTRKPDTVHPQRILAIAYQRKAMEQIKQRLSSRHRIRNVNVKTFHKLGKDILEEAGEYFTTSDIVNDNEKHAVISRLFKQRIRTDMTYYHQFLKFIRTLNDKNTREPDEATGKSQVLEYARQRPYFSINNTQVNSRAEKDLMDFFLMHKLNGRAIAVQYEPDMGGFRPDFHLPEFDLFIEHWGLTQDGEVPKWFSQSTAEYRQSMTMKKQWFTQHQKLLVETFAYEYNEENPQPFLDSVRTRICSALQAKYDQDFKFTLKSYEEVLDLAWQSYRTPEDDITSFITIAKTYGLTPEGVERKLRKGHWSSKQEAFGYLTIPIFIDYEDVLEESRKIDFEDMINKAIAKLENDSELRANLYDHILIDEYQDISAQRYKLIKTLMDQNPTCKLFCVGDDWQSIMGFSGSNLNFFVNFDQYFNDPAITKISTNYRSIKTIVDAGATLIRNNTQCQIQKPAHSRDRRTRPIRVLTTPTNGFEDDSHSQAAKDCIGRIQHYLQNGWSPEDILVLSRCMRTRTKPRGYKFLSYVKTLLDTAADNDMQLAHDRVHVENKVRLLTAHRSKGLEAKVVFLLNVTDDTYGFPCQIEDSTIFDLARENYPPQDHLEEERRLFYVAVTRAMEDLFIYTKELAQSAFLQEISDFTTMEPLSEYRHEKKTKTESNMKTDNQMYVDKSYSRRANAVRDGGQHIREKQARFAKFVEELKQKGIRGQEYREKIAQWNREHDDE